jgi:hypothetical protein
MTDRCHCRCGVDLPALSPKEAEIVRVFADALRQLRELEIEKLRFALYGLELYCDGMDALNADMRAGRLS